MFRSLDKSVFIVGLLLITSTAVAQRVKVIEPTGMWVTDLGEFLSPTEERLLTRKLSGYADTTSTQIIVVTLNNLGGYAPVDYAVELGRRWGVGQSGQDNGLIILLSKQDREVFIATGFGLEGAVTDALASNIVRNVMVPRFREGQFFQGISDAIDLLVLAALGEFTAEDIPRGDKGRGTFPLNFILIIAFILYSVFSRARRGGGRGGKRHHGSSGLLPIILWSALGGGHSRGFGGGGFGGGGFGGGGFGGFGGGGGSFGGGGAGGGW